MPPTRIPALEKDMPLKMPQEVRMSTPLYGPGSMLPPAVHVPLEVPSPRPPLKVTPPLKKPRANRWEKVTMQRAPLPAEAMRAMAYAATG